MVIVYKKTHFKAPARISEAAFLHYKQLLSKDLHMELVASPLSFTGKFRRTLTYLPWMLIAFLLLTPALVYYFKPNFKAPEVIALTLFFIDVIIGVLTIGFLMKLFLEGPSYATYLKESHNYFSRMKMTIGNAPDYTQFCDAFYSVNKAQIKTPVPQKNSEPPSLDRTLTDIFYRIDQYAWIVLAIGLALFFGRKLLIHN